MQEPVSGNALSRALAGRATSHIELGTAVLIVEQQAQQILRIADQVFVIRAGRLISQGPTDNYRGEHALRQIYLSEHKIEQQQGRKL